MEFVGSAEISRVTNHKFAFQPPRPTKWIILGEDDTNLVILAPVGDEVETLRRSAARQYTFSHAITYDHVSRGFFQGSIADLVEAFADRPF
jgi:hypothetical protein